LQTNAPPRAIRRTGEREAGGRLESPPASPTGERDLIKRYVESVIVMPQALEVSFAPTGAASDQADRSGAADGNLRSTIAIMLPWTAQNFVTLKGIVHSPSSEPEMTPENRDALLAAIAKARRWIEDLRLGRVASFAEIAVRESPGERYVRQLASLAFVSPRVVTAIVEGRLRADLTVSGLARAVATFLGRAGTARRVRSVKSEQIRRANRSLSVSNQSAGMPKWKLKNCEQRPAPQMLRNLERDSADHQVETRNAELTRGDLGLSHTPGNLAVETVLGG